MFGRLKQWWRDVLKWKSRFDRLIKPTGPGIKNYNYDWQSLNRKDGRRIASQLNKMGFKNTPSKFNQHKHLNNFAESTYPGEINDFKLIFKNIGKKSVLDGYQVKLFREGAKPISIKIDAESPITKNQAVELLHGRPVHTGSTNWMISNLNDCDAKGNINLREVNIEDFDLKRSLSKIPGLNLNEKELMKVSNGMKEGKRMNLDLKIGRSTKTVGIEANPLKRDFSFYVDNTKVGFDELKEGKSKKNVVVMKMDVPKRSLKKGMKL